MSTNTKFTGTYTHTVHLFIFPYLHVAASNTLFISCISPQHIKASFLLNDINLTEVLIPAYFTCILITNTWDNNTACSLPRGRQTESQYCAFSLTQGLEYQQSISCTVCQCNTQMNRNGFLFFHLFNWFLFLFFSYRKLSMTYRKTYVLNRPKVSDLL